MASSVLRLCMVLSAIQCSWCGNPCDRKPEPPYLDSAMFLNQSCYFTVINGTESSTVEEWNLFRFEYVFNMTNAREMCAMHGATLPIINSDEENRFVASYEAHEFSDEWGEKKIFRVALGVSSFGCGIKEGYFQRNPTTNTYEWDDGTLVTYEPSHGWERKHWPSRDCATLRRQVAEPVWLSFPCHGVGIGRLGVICKKVINPDCQYAYRVSNSCAWDDLDKKCYEMMAVDVLAPALKGGKECPEYGMRKECECKDPKKDWQKDDNRLGISGCDPSLEKPCPLVGDKVLGAANGVRAVVFDAWIVAILMSSVSFII